MNRLIRLLQNKELRKKVALTLLILVIFRLLAAVPLPAIPLDALKELFNQTQAFSAISAVSGGVLEKTTLLAIGLAPYISASYIFQLLSAVVPKIKEMYEGGPSERKVLTMYTRLLSVPLALIQSFAIYGFLTQQNIIGNLDVLTIASTLIMLTFGAVLTMWLGELITEYGLTNGSSIIITAGILVNLPANFRSIFTDIVNSQELLIVVAILVAMLIISVVLSMSEFRVPIQYARRVRTIGEKLGSYLPIKLNPAGVMPVIFAVSLVSFPSLIIQFASQQDRFPGLQEWALNNADLVQSSVFYNTVLFVTVVFFAFFSAFLIFKPKDVAKNLSKQAAFIPGVRPGRSTEKFLRSRLVQNVVIGAFLLVLLTVAPSIILSGLKLEGLAISGTSILIVVAVVLDIIRQVNAMQVMEARQHSYY